MQRVRIEQMAHALGIDIEAGFLAAPVPENDAIRVTALRAQVLAWGDMTSVGPAVTQRPPTRVGQPLPSAS